MYSCKTFEIKRTTLSLHLLARESAVVVVIVHVCACFIQQLGLILFLKMQETMICDKIDYSLPVETISDNANYYWSQLKANLKTGNILEEVISFDGKFYGASSYLQPSGQIGFLHSFVDLVNHETSITIDPMHGLCSGLDKLLEDRIICSFDDGYIGVYNLDLTMQEQRQISHSYITRLKKNDQSFIVGDYDGRLTNVDAETLDPIAIVDKVFDGAVTDVLARPNGLIIASGSDGNVLMWDERTNNKLGKLAIAKALMKVLSQPTVMQWTHADDMEFFLGTEKGSIVRFDIRSWKVVNKQDIFANERIHLIKEVLLKNSVSMVTSSEQSSHQVRFYDIDFDACLHKKTYPNETNIRSLSQLSTGEIIVVGGQGSSLFSEFINLSN